MTWTTYTNDRLIKKDDVGFFVIKPTATDDEFFPIDCNVCGLLMRTSDDELSWSKYKCCNFCAMKWAMPRVDTWNNGWRPSEEDVKLDVASRPSIIVTVNVDI